MKIIIQVLVAAFFLTSITSCISKKQLLAVQSDLETCNQNLVNSDKELNKVKNQFQNCQTDKKKLQDQLSALQENNKLRIDQINDLKAQIDDLKKVRDIQVSQIGDLTDLSQSSSANINKTLSQLQDKERHLNLLRAAKSRADSINLALAVNLKGVLSQGIDDQDVQVKVDKTVVFVNLSDKMVYQSGSSIITPRAREVLGKIAKIIESRPELEVMVEGYTDNVPVRSSCLQDNWDLSVRRATSVVRTLQKEFRVDPNRMIAAGRGEYNTLADNSTSEGRALNRRTRIIILPKVDQFYDLLDPSKAAK